MLDCGVRPVAFPVHQSEFSDEVARPTTFWAVVDVHDDRIQLLTSGTSR
jgi:hypothetical protein